jgi:hypothetical protein
VEYHIGTFVDEFSIGAANIWATSSWPLSRLNHHDNIQTVSMHDKAMVMGGYQSAHNVGNMFISCHITCVWATSVTRHFGDSPTSTYVHERHRIKALASTPRRVLVAIAAAMTSILSIHGKS